GARPGSAIGARALFLAATLLEDGDDAERARARAHFATVAAQAPTRAQRAEARWRVGWMAWRADEPAAAAEAFEAVARLEVDALERLRPRYWRARALDRLGRESEAQQAFAAIVRGHPFTYYGLRAARRLEEAPADDGSRAGAGASGVSDPQPAASAGLVTLPDRALVRARILLEAALREEARRELPDLTRRVRTDADRLALGRLLADAGDPHAAQQLVLVGQWERLAAGPEPGLEGLWRLAWPRAFAPLVEAPARRHGVEPALVFAVMREESGYRPEVVSSVGARGLLQIMPDTGVRLAGSLGRAGFEPAALFEPATNLELGAYYLSELLARFRGRRSAAVAAYNAGPGAVQRWLDARGQVPDDEWVESIPYAQTRQYVRRVLRSWHVYRVLE
ncbi:MAG: transglycosylase SLT domain-containing protein, partial [Myxococcota bacterium]|nr:transglycosylase SLT domain-containing protein [Myxococcota bacterium]